MRTVWQESMEHHQCPQREGVLAGTAGDPPQLEEAVGDAPTSRKTPNP